MFQKFRPPSILEKKFLSAITIIKSRDFYSENSQISNARVVKKIAHLTHVMARKPKNKNFTGGGPKLLEGTVRLPYP